MPKAVANHDDETGVEGVYVRICATTRSGRRILRHVVRAAMFTVTSFAVFFVFPHSLAVHSFPNTLDHQTAFTKL